MNNLKASFLSAVSSDRRSVNADMSLDWLISSASEALALGVYNKSHSEYLFFHERERERERERVSIPAIFNS